MRASYRPRSAVSSDSLSPAPPAGWARPFSPGARPSISRVSPGVRVLAPVLCRRPVPAGLLAAVAAVLMVSGCSDATKRKWKPRSAEENYRVALEAEHPDDRREAVTRIGESSYRDSEDAFHILDAVARTDPVTQIRCIAIRTLGAYEDDRPVPTLLTILRAAKDSTSDTSGDALPADDDVRWEAAKALLALVRRGVAGADHRGTACDLFIQLLRSDPSRNVRIVSAQALGTFQDPKVFAPLINALTDPDFMIADSAEQSLIALTGVTHDYDADAWTQWLSETSAPFEHAGRTPVTTRPAGPTWWDKQQRAWRRALKLGGTD